MTDRPSMDDVLLEMAGVLAQRSTCERARVGVVVAIDGRICSTGYNGAPHGMPHCVHRSDVEDSPRGCAVSVHAEANAIAFAAKHGVPIDGATLYTTLSPCVPCAMLILNTGIIRVICAVRYRDVTGAMLLKQAGLHVSILDTDLRSSAVEPRRSTDPLRGQRGDGV